MLQNKEYWFYRVRLIGLQLAWHHKYMMVICCTNLVNMPFVKPPVTRITPQGLTYPIAWQPGRREYILYIDGILQKGPYLPCVSMAGRGPFWQDTIDMQIRKMHNFESQTSKIFWIYRALLPCEKINNKYQKKCKLYNKWQSLTTELL